MFHARLSCGMSRACRKCVHLIQNAARFARKRGNPDAASHLRRKAASIG
jgi:hypothetical protein